LTFLLIAPGVLAAQAQDQPPVLAIDSPMPYQVFQRQTAKLGFVAVRGTVNAKGQDDAIDQIRVCVVPEAAAGKNAEPAQCPKIHYDRAAHSFSGMVATPAGGFYRVELRMLRKGRPTGESSVEHVGVGEVFVISGQSNSTNYGEVRQMVTTGFVTTFDGKQWRIADDPQPGVQDNSSKGSFIPAFGDAMFTKFHVPIGIAAVGHGSTSVRQWLPKGGLFTTQPTMTRFTREVAPGVWECDGTLFDGMMTRIRELDAFAPHGKHGFRALLWHQGESDAHQKPPHEISAEEYRKLLTDVIVSSRRSAGWRFPWFVAQVSYHTPDDPKTPEIRDAQASLWRSGVALEGPDTDQLTGLNRQNHGTGVHMSDTGLKAHGRSWAEKVGPWLEGVLGHP
jgi:hypothetical protein